MSLIDLITGAGGLGLLSKAYKDLEKLGTKADRLGTELAEEQLEQTQFQPYTIKTATGGQFMAEPDGSYTMQLTPREQAIQNALFGRSSNLLGQPVIGADQLQQAGLGSLGRGQEMLGQDVFGVDPTRAASTQAFGLGSQFMEQAGLPLGERTAEVYGQIRGLQEEEEEIDRLNLEQRLAAQGRLGVRTSQFGGTPEQLALAKAQESARNQAAFDAINQARSEQAQQAQLGAQYAGLSTGLAGQAQGLSAAQQAQALQAMQAGQGLLGGSQGLQIGQQQLGLGALAGAYMPQQQLLPALSAGQTAAAQQQQAQMYGAGLYGEARASGLDMLLSSYLGRANLAGSLGSGLLSGALPGILEDGFSLSTGKVSTAPTASQSRMAAPGTQMANGTVAGALPSVLPGDPVAGRMPNLMGSPGNLAMPAVMPPGGTGLMSPRIV